MDIDIRVMELLASKLCHDLVSPVSAINNGVELIEDIGGSVVEEAMKLISDSGATAARRLRLYRMAYGRGGSEENLSVKDMRQIAEQYLGHGKVTLAWAEGVPGEEATASRGYLKTILNMLVMAEEALAYGGVVTLRQAGTGCRIEIVGRNAQLNLALQEALEGSTSIEELTPRSIQAYVTGRYAAQFGLKLTHSHTAVDHLDLELQPQTVVQQEAPPVEVAEAPPSPPIAANQF